MRQNALDDQEAAKRFERKTPEKESETERLRLVLKANMSKLEETSKTLNDQLYLGTGLDP